MRLTLILQFHFRLSQDHRGINHHADYEEFDHAELIEAQMDILEWGEITEAAKAKAKERPGWNWDTINDNYRGAIRDMMLKWREDKKRAKLVDAAGVPE